MTSNELQKNIKHIIQGSIINGQNNYLTSAPNFLSSSFKTNTTITKNFQEQSSIKKEQAQQLIEFITTTKKWLHELSNTLQYLTQGGEAKIYFAEDAQHVIKLNDAVYYNTWLDFLNSVLIHNLLFEDTAYQLLGFTIVDNELLAILKQPSFSAESLCMALKRGRTLRQVD